jgi:hypothetical protein
MPLTGGLSDGSSFTAGRMLRPSIAVGDLMFSENLMDVVIYTLSGFVPSGATPCASIALQTLVCFIPGTDITTPNGPRLIESLIPGDLVTTQDHGNQPIRWIGVLGLSSLCSPAATSCVPLGF